MTITGRIDPHVHFRDGRQAYKETIAHGLELAYSQRVEAVFDMPNTEPPITTMRQVRERLKLVPVDAETEYFLYVGATSKPQQLDEAVQSYLKIPEVIGIKMFAGRSVGDLAVVKEEDQRSVYKMLSDFGYDGVLAVHCEKESLLKPKMWNPEKPISHCFARPVEAEIESVRDQIRFAKEAGFKGTLHICHISCPESVDLVDAARGDLIITCGVTPHHLMWTEAQMMTLQHYGLLYKMNPPLRDADSVCGLKKRLQEGKINWIETDHAPHAVGEKLYPPYLSGYPSLYLYHDFVEDWLTDVVGERAVERLTVENIKKAFGRKLA